MKHYFPLFLIAVFVLVSNKDINAQEANTTKATLTVTKEPTLKPLLQYLFNTYGIEESEEILLKIQDYESNNNLKVLFNVRYNLEIQKIEIAITNSKTKEESFRLTESKSRIINFSQIETIVTQN